MLFDKIMSRAFIITIGKSSWFLEETFSSSDTGESSS